MMPTVYVAGPYRHLERAGIEQNIRNALAIGLLCCRKGWSPIIPHSNTAHLDAVDPTIGDEFWLAATMELMRRCDAVVLVPGWQESIGTRAEIQEAQIRGIPVYYVESDLPTADEFIEGLRT